MDSDDGCAWTRGVASTCHHAEGSALRSWSPAGTTTWCVAKNTDDFDELISDITIADKGRGVDPTRLAHGLGLESYRHDTWL
jgi:hypothetical protein